MLELAISMFELAGYSARIANKAAGGTEFFQTHPEIDLIFPPLILPEGVEGVKEVKGIEMAKTILNERPECKTKMRD